MKLKNRLTLIFILLIFVSITFVSIFNYYSFRSSLITETSSNLEIIANSYYERLHYSFEHKKEIMNFVSSKLHMRMNLKKFYDTGESKFLDMVDEILLDFSLDTKDNIKEIIILNQKGLLVTSQNKDLLVDKDYSKEDFFRKSINKTHLYISKDKFSFKTYISTPLYLDEEFLGVIVLVSDIVEIKKISEENKNFRNTEEVLVGIEKDNEIHFLNEPRFNYDKNSLTNYNNSKLSMAYALEGEENLYELEDYRGEKVFAYTKYLPEYELGLVVEIDKSEVFEDLNSLLYRTMIFSILLFILVVIISYLFSRSISNSINDLTKKVDRIMDGELDVKLKKSNIEEVNSLTKALDRILASLKLAILKVGVKKEELSLGEAIEAKEKAEESAKKRAIQLERFVKLAIGREIKMIELKKEIDRLKTENKKSKRKKSEDSKKKKQKKIKKQKIKKSKNKKSKR